MLLLDALFINNSGGKVLLDYLVRQLHQSGKDVFYLLDSRIEGQYKYLPADKVAHLKPNLWARHQFYADNETQFTSVLCFGNVPPSRPINAEVYTYFHNVLFLNPSPEFQLPERWSLLIKAYIIRCFKGNTDKWIVQTAEVKRELARRWNIRENFISVLPFFEPPADGGDSSAKRKKDSFIYVSDGNPYKMHINLLRAFESLFSNHRDITLTLTISSNYPDLLKLIEDCATRGIPVKNVGWVDRSTLNRLTEETEFFIFPSMRESFGLGLVEAAQKRMKILAADLPYVHSVIEPSAVFDPLCVESICGTMEKALAGSLIPAQLKVRDSVGELIDIL